MEGTEGGEGKGEDITWRKLLSEKGVKSVQATCLEVILQTAQI